MEKTKKNKEIFVVYKNKEGKFFAENDKENSLIKVELAVKRPSNEQQQEAQKVYAKSFREFVEAGAIVRPQLDAILRSRNMWDDVRQKEFDSLTQKINNNTLKIRKGGIKFNDATKIAKDTIKLRNELFRLTLEKNQLDQNTAESQSENTRFNYLIAVCTVYNDTGKSFFESYEDYKKQDQVGNVVVNLAGEGFWKLTTGLGSDFREDFFEYKFLKKYSLCDEKLRLIDKQNRLIDLEGNFIDENGRFIKYGEDGKTFIYIDKDGNEVDKEGNPIVEFVPFLDEEGNPIEEKKNDDKKE